MNWAAIGAVGEVGGAIAVVVTLFYLASQIKQNTSVVRAESRRAALEGGHTILFTMVENPTIIADIIKSEPLNDEERIRLSAFLFAMLRFGEFAWGQYREGAIDREQWPQKITYSDSFSIVKEHVIGGNILDAVHLAPSFRSL